MTDPVPALGTAVIDLLAIGMRHLTFTLGAP